MAENPAPPASPAPPPPPPALLERILKTIGTLRLPFLIVAIHFAVFSLARLWLVLRYKDADFAGLSGGDIVWGFVRGLRFDGAIVFLIIGIPVFLLMLPFRPLEARLARGILGWWCFATLVLFSFVLACDVIYFGYVHQHVGAELAAPGEALEAVALTGAVQYLVPFLAFVLAGVGGFFAWKRLLGRRPTQPADPLWRTGVALLLAALMVWGWRGALHGRKTNLIDAFQGVPRAAGYVALNGPFAILEARDTKSLKCDFYPWEEAVRTAREAILTPEEKGVDPQYPLLRSLPAGAPPKPNVVLIMLESWDAAYTDVCSGEMGLAPLGLTPSFDAISRQGVLFTRFYAAGQKSMHGMAALLAGFPTLPKSPNLGHGMEKCALPFLGNLARREGYSTLFIQSSHRTAFRNDSVAQMAGFETYLGAEDLPPADPVAGRAVLGGAAWDHEMFAEANRRLASAKRPFLAYLYTATTHAPFEWPGPEWEKFSKDDPAWRYKNSLSYADWALGKFFAGAKAAGYFDSTIFILTADHVGCPHPRTLGDPSDGFRIPGLVIAPGLAPAIDRRIGGQLDVLPTIAHLAGWSAAYSACGRSLFRDARDRGCFCVMDQFILRVEEGGSVLHNLSGRMEARKTAPAADLDAIERRLLSICQVAATLQRKNRLYPPVTDARKE